jgi:AraC-like DNA-binding protein
MPEYFSEQVAASQRFYRTWEEQSELPLSVIAGGRERCSPGYKIERLNFPFFCIEFVAGGNGEVTLNGTTSALNPGSIFAYGPNVPHSIKSCEEKPLEKYFVDITGNEARTLLLNAPCFGNVLYTSAPKRILDTFEEITYYGLTESHLTDTICQTLVKLLILKIEETSLAPSDALSPAFATYQRCRNLINTSFMQLHSLNDIAQTATIDPAYLCRIFKRFDAQGPYHYLMKLKMNYAAELLTTPGSMVKNVARELGFTNQFHFSRSFKKIIGVSPTRFKELQ